LGKAEDLLVQTADFSPELLKEAEEAVGWWAALRSIRTFRLSADKSIDLDGQQ
jgi:hypothetical protein